MRVEFCDENARAVRVRRVERELELCVAKIDAVEERLAVEQVRVIDVEHDLADDRERAAVVFHVHDFHVARDEAVERVERKSADRDGEAALLEFAVHVLPPVAREALAVHVPAAPQQRDHEKHGGDFEEGKKNAAHEISDRVVFSHAARKNKKEVQ